MSTASEEGQEPDCAPSLVHPASAKGCVPQTCYKFPGLYSFPRPLWRDAVLQDPRRPTPGSTAMT